MGLPSKWWRYFYVAALVMIPLCLLAPVLARLVSRMSFLRKQESSIRKPARPIFSLWTRGIAAMLAFMFLVGPFELQVMADNANLYDSLATTDWSNGATEIVYEYYDTGAVKTKTVSGTDEHSVNYEYDFRNRLSKVKETRGSTDKITKYTYNYAGIRVKSHHWTEISSVGQGDDVYTTYLIDPANHTGYAQVLEEWTDGSDPDVTYTIGDDVINQSKVGVVSYLLYDGHGSTRQLSNLSAEITDCYSYDAYGVMLGGNPSASSPATTNLLYSGEQYDNNLQQYYLRARYYDQNNGRFNRVDPFAGNMQDPQSLHKYLYCHANPVNGIDPSGNFIEGFLIVYAIACILFSIYMTYAFNFAWGVEDVKPKKRIAIIYKMGYEEPIFAFAETAYKDALVTDLNNKGHRAKMWEAPDEATFIGICNSNDIVVVICHGNEGEDTQGKPMPLFGLGGTQINSVDGGKDFFITPREVTGKINNPDLEFITSACKTGKSDVMYKAINPKIYIASDKSPTSPGVETALRYAANRASGDTIEEASGKVLDRPGWVMYPR